MASFTSDLRDARADLITSTLGSGCKLKIYDAGGVLLATWVWTGSLAPAASGGVLTFNMPSSVSVIIAATGTATNAKLTKADDIVKVSNLTVGTSSAAIIVNVTAFVTGAAATFVSGSYTEGNV